MKKSKKVFLLFLVLLMVLSFIGCGKVDETSETEESVTSDIMYKETFDNGSTSFTFEVIDLDENDIFYLVKTDKKTVGEALLETGLISGEDSDYGLYVTTVDGLTLDYNKEGKYWAFYIDHEYALTGVDATEIVEGTIYTFRAE